MLVVKNLCEIVCKRLIVGKNGMVEVLKEINIEYELVKVRSYWNNEIVRIKVDCE